MEDVQTNIDASGKGGFYIMDGEERLAEMVVEVSGKQLTVYHTEVFPKAEGKGLAKKLLAAMVDYARSNSLQVVPLCAFVLAQFKRHPEMYSDLWKGVE